MRRELGGGYGAMRDLPLQAYVRDAVGFSRSDGINQAMRPRTATLLAADD